MTPNERGRPQANGTGPKNSERSSSADPSMAATVDRTFVLDGFTGELIALADLGPGEPMTAEQEAAFLEAWNASPMTNPTTDLMGRLRDRHERLRAELPTVTSTPTAPRMAVSVPRVGPSNDDEEGPGEWDLPRVIDCVQRVVDDLGKPRLEVRRDHIVLTTPEDAVIIEGPAVWLPGEYSTYGNHVCVRLRRAPWSRTRTPA